MVQTSGDISFVAGPDDRVGNSPSYNPPASGGTARTQSGKYDISDDQYSQLGKDAWKLGNNSDWYGKGWLDIKDYGGKGDYQFAYDDSQNIGKVDPNDMFRYLYVRKNSEPENFQRFSLGNPNDSNIDMADLGRSLYNSGNNLLDDFWANWYGWKNASPGQEYNPVGSDPVTPPIGVRPDQGASPVEGGITVPGPGNPEPSTPEEGIEIGMGGARDAYENMLNMPQYYPKWWGEDYQTIDPSKYIDQFPKFLDVPEYQGITMPGEYQGLQGGDFDRLEEVLRQPGEIAAKNAYDQGANYLKNIMGSSGLYGSSMMGQQANEGLARPYMDTMTTNAANAAAKRYGLQQQDLQFGANYGLNLADLQQQDLMNKYTADMTGRNLLNDYNNQAFQFGYGLDEAARGEYNNRLQNKFQYELASQDWRNALNERYLNAGLALAGKNAQLNQANQNYQLTQDAYNQSNLGSGIGMGIDFIDRLGGFDWAGDQLGSIFDSIFKKKK